METSRFDSLVRALGEGGATRRTLAGLAGGALLAALPIAGEAKKKKKKKKCKPDSTAVTCNGKCGSVTNNCKQAVNCGSCNCKQTCDFCFTCKAGSNTPGTCVVDQKKVGTSCGSPGQKCQPDGSCNCTKHSDCGDKAICDTGSCEACDVCASGCDYESPQQAIRVGWPEATDPITVRICPGEYGRVYKDIYTPNATLIGAGDGTDDASNTIFTDTGSDEWVARFEGGTSTLRGVRITGGNGGGLYNNESTLHLADCTIAGNSIVSQGGGITNNGTLNATNVKVTGNTAANEGGGIFNFSGSTITFAGSNVVAQNDVTDTNSAYRGSGIRNEGTINGIATVDIHGNTPADSQCSGCPA